MHTRSKERVVGVSAQVLEGQDRNRVRKSPSARLAVNSKRRLLWVHGGYIGNLLDVARPDAFGDTLVQLPSPRRADLLVQYVVIQRMLKLIATTGRAIRPFIHLRPH